MKRIHFRKFSLNNFWHFFLASLDSTYFISTRIFINYKKILFWINYWNRGLFYNEFLRLIMMKYIILMFYFVSTNFLKNILSQINFFEKIFPLKFDITVNLFSESSCKAFSHSKTWGYKEIRFPVKFITLSPETGKSRRYGNFLNPNFSF